MKELRDIENNSNPTQDQITRKSILEERIRSSMIDYKYAIRYWMENPSKVTDGSYALMVKHLVKSAHNFGHLGLFANRGGLDEKDKMNVSAHRALARQLGYGVGAAKLDRQTGIISMPIRPLLSSKTT